MMVRRGSRPLERVMPRASDVEAAVHVDHMAGGVVERAAREGCLRFPMSSGGTAFCGLPCHRR
jgi:hypothetical protein